MPTTDLAPCFSKVLVVARPSPEAAPVTTAVFPAKSMFYSIYKRNNKKIAKGIRLEFNENVNSKVETIYFNKT